tara:strand:- start:2433 stop:3665 length:1233 start_codon:yes stop_codon:yes gene_type:complete
MNIIFIIIIGSIVFEFLLTNLSRILDLKQISTDLPTEFSAYYKPNKYVRSQNYFKDNIKFAFIVSLFDLLIIFSIIYFGLLNILDLWIQNFTTDPILSGLLFFGVIILLQDLINTPFTIYKIFVLENKYEFNNITANTFVLDKIKSYFVISIIGGGLLSLVLYFFQQFPHFGWFYAWLLLSFFLILIQPIYTLFIAPLFNTFKPLEKGELKDMIINYSKKVDFPISKIDIMDGSRRSSKANAYFSGLGKNKRIALFDTLLNNHTNNELLSIIAHEVGHYKKNHNIKGILLTIMQSGIMFIILSFFINNNDLFAVFKMTNISVYAGLFLFSILYSPIQTIINLFYFYISRKNEYEADAFARETIGTSKHLITALKKLTVDSLANLNPHYLTVILKYSHPPVLQRINALKND